MTAERDTLRTDTVRIFDTTLRDGEQSPGATMNVEEKVLIARQLEKLRVDVIEAGFAASSPGDFDSVARVAEAVSAPVVLSLARTREVDIQQGLKSVEKAKHPGIHIFIATSDIHLERKLMMSRRETIDAACWAVHYAKKYLDYIEFSAEDASRSDREYLVEVFAEVIKAGAVVLNVPDTTGYAVPEEFGGLIRYLISNTPGSRAGHLERALPQRPRHGRGELTGGGAQRRSPGRMHHQWHRRTRREHVDGRSRHGNQNAQGLLRSAYQHRDRANLSGESPAVPGHRARRAGQQAHRGRQCVRATRPESIRMGC